ncbi:PPE domain-containing protein [Nocardia sp. NPDC004168]|uniref:PPE domain-containing protein n=1 Tax=Nocardia sp. NPDC004168 TaxID=3154452 RepID=UPI0033BB8794
MEFDYLALPPEVNTARLLSGPGAAALGTTAAAYADLAAGLSVAASGTDGLTAVMGVVWQGPSSDVAQAAFRRHAGWSHRQSAVALDAATSAAELGSIFIAAQEAMTDVAVWLAEWHAKQAALAAASTTQLAPLTLAAMAASELEYLAIAAAAAAVMVGYDSAASAVLAGLPRPEIPLPIVSGGSIPEGASIGSASPGIRSPTIGDNGVHTSQSDVGSSQTGDSGGSNPDPTHPSQPLDTAQPTNMLPDMDNPSSLSDSPVSSSGAGSDAGSMDQQGLLGVSQDSTTLAGMYGGVGSLVALSMTRGGPSVMSGAATGFRMPSNWSPGRGTAFGAPSNPPVGGPVSRQTAPRGASAPNVQMRRRRRDEDRENSAVFVPGEPQDVPVTERPPVFGVIEYGDADRWEEPESPETEQSPLIGVIRSAADEPATADRRPAR